MLTDLLIAPLNLEETWVLKLASQDRKYIIFDGHFVYLFTIQRTNLLNILMILNFSQTVANDRALAGEVDRLAGSNPQMMFFVVTSNKNNNGDM